MHFNKTVEKWGILEIVLRSEKKYINPFTDVKLEALFAKGNITKRAEGFYDGDCTWKIRFMPEETGEYSFSIASNNKEFDGLKGYFESLEPSRNNHGPVKAYNKYHFSYSDGTPFFVMGTTAYAWTYRPEEVRRKTLESFSKYGFNKIRMLVFPKHYTDNNSKLEINYEPPVYPFAGEPGKFDFYSPNPEYFRNFEDRVKDLMDLGIEADVILFHPYDPGHWGIAQGMKQEHDLFYLRYIIARLASYRNVWWSLANEYEGFSLKDGEINHNYTTKKWDLIGSFVKANDPYGHLISIHNFTYGEIYPDRDWMTHVSYQHPDTYTLLYELKNRYGKPVIDDEYQYEGNLSDEWGNSSAETTLLRHWLSVMAGGYATHGEVFIIDGNKKDLFWSYGGTMVGQSAPRLKFMKEIVESVPYQEMRRDPVNTDGHNYFSICKEDEIYLVFFRHLLPNKNMVFGKLDGTDPEYEATIYDVWNCKIKDKFTTKRWYNSGSNPDLTDWTVLKLVKKL